MAAISDPLSLLLFPTLILNLISILCFRIREIIILWNPKVYQRLPKWSQKRLRDVFQKIKKT